MTRNGYHPEDEQDFDDYLDDDLEDNVEYYDALNDELEGAVEYSLEDALAALPLQDTRLVPPAVLEGLSNLPPEALNQVRPLWERLPENQRTLLMERFAEASEADYQLDYGTIAYLGYDDPSAAVREAAIMAGWSDETLPTMHKLMDMAQHDPAPLVRATAMMELGRYISLGENGDLDKSETLPVEELALRLHQNLNENLSVRCGALEAIGNCTRDEVPALIQAAYEDGDLALRKSALNAMGSSCDERWSKIVLDELDNPHPPLAFEAIRAAGTLGLQDSVDKLKGFALGDDPQLQEAAIWSLGEIGGQAAIEALNAISYYAEEEGDEELADAVDEALAMAVVLSDLALFDMDFMETDDDNNDDYPAQ
jgi:HEAT repeat protein